MITIEEKIKLFTKIIYDKVEKQNQVTIDKFNCEYGNMIEQKKKEFQEQAEEIMSEGLRDIEKEKTRILSRARIDEKRIVLESQKRIFNETLEQLVDYASKFTEDNSYGDILMRDMDMAFAELDNGSNINLYITSKDKKRFEMAIAQKFNAELITIEIDDSIIGGFIAVDGVHNIKIDMSFLSGIMNSKNYIGERLFGELR